MQKELARFLLDANKAGYASGNDNAWKKEPDHSKTITFTSGDWVMNDNFFGGEPYGGREIVFLRGNPYWIMVYYGEVDNAHDPKQIYPFLQKALSQPPEDMPLRGPESFQDGKYTYKNTFRGNLDQFSGEEVIFEGDTQIYRASYLGGLVDQRAE